MNLKKKIVVIDDDHDTCSYLADALRSGGFDVETFENPFQAVHKCKQVDPDLILIDFRMPQADGTHILLPLRNAAPRADILMLTGFGTPSMILEALRNGACEILHKPISPEDLLGHVRRHFEKEVLTQPKAPGELGY